MEVKSEPVGLKIAVVVSYLVMVGVNSLANILPINGVGTGQVSDAYPNLFAPAGYAFAIWGLIYLLLAVFVLYFIGAIGRRDNEPQPEWMQSAARYFILSSLANAAWIFAWHYRLIPLSVVLMIVILVCLATISLKIMNAAGDRQLALLVRLPFSVYFGWITVASIANITVLLVSLGWDGWGWPTEWWTIIMLAAGTLIGGLTTLKQRDAAYGMVIVWAYGAIVFKHLTPAGFAGAYPSIILTASICIVLLLAAIVRVLFLAAEYHSPSEPNSANNAMASDS